MKILLISPYLPIPPVGGLNVRVLNFLKNLHGKHEIILLCFIRSEEERQYIKEVEQFTYKVIPILRPSAWTLKNLLKAAFSRYPFLTVVNNFNKETETAIRRVMEEEKPQIVHLETFFMAQSVLAVKDAIKVPIFLVKNNIEYRVYSRNAKSKINPIFKLLGYFDAWKMYNYEIEVAKTVDILGYVSEVDKEWLTSRLKKQSVEKPTYLVPNGVDTHYFSRSGQKDDKPSLIFGITNFRYFANIDAAFYFFNDIWPKVKQKVKDATWYVVGRKLTPGLQMLFSNDVGKIKGDGVVVTGSVSEAEKMQYLSKSWVFTAPLRVGSGTKLKILEAMSMELPVVTTSVGIEGIDARHGESFLLADEPENFAAKVVQLLNDGALRDRVGKAARKLVEEKYDWRIITQNLEGIYQKIAEK
jgi:glycosyltransferase involved in cell wall biosynthesis